MTFLATAEANIQKYLHNENENMSDIIEHQGSSLRTHSSNSSTVVTYDMSNIHCLARTNFSWAEGAPYSGVRARESRFSFFFFAAFF